MPIFYAKNKYNCASLQCRKIHRQMPKKSYTTNFARYRNNNCK